MVLVKGTPKKLKKSKNEPSESPNIIGVKQQKTPKSATKKKGADLSDAGKKKKKSTSSGTFQVMEITDKNPSAAAESLETDKKPRKKKEKKHEVDTIDETLTVQTKAKKSKNEKDLPDKDDVEAPILVKKKKSKKLSIEDAVEIEQQEISTASVGKKKKRKLAQMDAAAEEESEDKPTKKKKSIEKEHETEEAEGTEGTNKAESPQKKGRRKTRRSKPKKENSAYCVFVGNIPYKISEEDITNHFSKAGLIPSRVYLAKDKANLLRGFAFVDFPDNDQYTRALKLDGSHMKNRRLRVRFTCPGKKNDAGRMKMIKAKNQKLHAMTKKGISFGNQETPKSTVIEEKN